MCRFIFLLLLMATIMPWLLVEAPNGGGYPMCYEGSNETSHADYTERVCPNQDENEVECFSFECSGDDSKPSLEAVACGSCPLNEIPANCKCTPCTGHLCNLPKGWVKECYVGRPDSSGKYEKEECKLEKREGCHTIVHNGGESVQDFEKSCGKCPKELPEGDGCFDCNEKDLCNINKDKGSIKECYAGKFNISTGEFEKKKCRFFNNDVCQTIECVIDPHLRPAQDNNIPPNIVKNCGKCPTQEELDRNSGPGAKCTCSECVGDLCNKEEDKGPIKQCYGGKFNVSTGEFEKKKCHFFNNDACQTTECSNFNQFSPSQQFKDIPNIEKSCGKCPSSDAMRRRGDECKCTQECVGDLCNKEKDKGSIKECFGGWLGNSVEFEKEKCHFFNSDACHTIQCGSRDQPIPSMYKSCGKCPSKEKLGKFFSGPGGKCTCIEECTAGDLCNAVVNKGSTKQCFEGTEPGKFKPGNCSFYNNDGCHTYDCNDDKEEKGCGKCPAVPKEGCKCSDCIGDMCNKEEFVEKCYWGDDQKGYEALTCKADSINNKACKKVKCIGDVDPESGLGGNVFRDCGKCTSKDNVGACKCFDCRDKNLCNGGMRIETTLFLLAMIGGGVVALVAMKPLVGIGI